MQEGAFAVIDCLGFKGIWQRFKGKENIILDRLCEISETVKNELDSEKYSGNLFGEYKSFIKQKDVDFQARFFSDTVFISLVYKNELKEIDENKLAIKKGQLINAISNIAVKILELFIKSEPYLTMRGCISYGEIVYQRDFYAGPAIDIAAEYMDIADGAFVWLHKSAELYYEAYRAENVRQNGHNIGVFKLDNLSPFLGCKSVNYSMPIKNRNNLQCYVLNPLANFENEEWRQEIISIYKRSMESNNIDVSLKQQNTLAFLNKCNEITINYYINITKMGW